MNEYMLYVRYTMTVCNCFWCVCWKMAGLNNHFIKWKNQMFIIFLLFFFKYVFLTISKNFLNPTGCVCVCELFFCIIFFLLFLILLLFLSANMCRRRRRRRRRRKRRKRRFLLHIFVCAVHSHIIPPEGFTFRIHYMLDNTIIIIICIRSFRSFHVQPDVRFECTPNSKCTVQILCTSTNTSTSSQPQPQCQPFIHCY